MDALTKNTQYNFRTNAALLEEAKKIVAAENVDMATIIRPFEKAFFKKRQFENDYLRKIFGVLCC